jgi:hypothetical protein
MPQSGASTLDPHNAIAGAHTPLVCDTVRPKNGFEAEVVDDAVRTVSTSITLSSNGIFVIVVKLDALFTSENDNR